METTAMAGDWIKVEKATARKPEVMVIAAQLSIHPDHAFGLCFRFWSWCDDHLIDGNARGVTEALVDALVDRSGFASALLSVGWLQARNGSLAVPNFDRHCSESAKSRALSAQRVAKFKQRKGNAASVTYALPREEKRREEKSNTSASADVIPPTPFRPPTVDEVRGYCLERKNSVDAETFVNFYTAKGWMVGKNKMKDWHACVRTWEQNENGKPRSNFSRIDAGQRCLG
jgi:hypothetical protein